MTKNFWGDELPESVNLPEAAPEGHPGYGRIDFEKLPNTRDLGGLVGANGRRVKHGLLLRSGALGFGSDADLARLRDEYDLRLDVDFRNLTELSEVPDPMNWFPKAKFVHAEIFSDSRAGITQEANREQLELERKLHEVAQGDSIVFMTLFYPNMLLGEQGITGYRTFLRELLSLEEGAALWHCYVGRDRCGMGTVLVQTMLGVSREDIVNDYLATNLYAPIQLTIDAPASLCFLEAVEDALADRGGFMGYITNTLGISESEIDAFREKYLEP